MSIEALHRLHHDIAALPPAAVRPAESTYFSRRKLTAPGPPAPDFM